MIPVLVLVLVIGFDRLMVSDRHPRLEPVRRGWRRSAPRLTAFVRAAPGTYTYLFVLLVTTWVLQTSSNAVAEKLLAERSTNLYQLARDPARAIFASAFWLSSPLELLVWLALFSLLVAPVEQWAGTGRTASVFILGHVGATLLTAAGLWLALRWDLVESSVVHATDVGASYGFAAVVAVQTYRLRGRLRTLYLAGIVLFVTASLAVDHGFTNWGHLLAVLIGLACYPLVRQRGDAGNPRRAAAR